MGCLGCSKYLQQDQYLQCWDCNANMAALDGEVWKVRLLASLTKPGYIQLVYKQGSPRTTKNVSTHYNYRLRKRTADL